ncbi:tetratricopeptide repeat protein [Anaerobacillus sp. CMMVII]|uniref:tetratricopeptide repeat protein n=1 Tax=Anaerobacillus sp. CMMVII TaxID=2755588 RepID=UPI0021B7CAD4|nr:tetratricopeptide repeat protein [Anaerobacillus sp. CMMVII]MCT8137713.1 tetratricopeptide repeat protein [Anaerobacillus sp. CMMVII]
MAQDSHRKKDPEIETKNTRYNETEKQSHFKKKFTILQTIGLLTITLLFSTGGGVALGNIYFWNSEDMKRINEQLEFYQEKVNNDPANLEDRIVLGYTHFLKGNNNQAVNEFKYVIDIDENYFDAYYNLGFVYLDEKKYYEALSMFNKTVQIAPADFKGHLQMGIAQRHLNMYDAAIASFQEANRLAPANANIIFQIGLVAEDMGDYENASEIFKDVLNYDPLFQKAIDALERVQKELKNVGDKDE